MAQWVFEDPLQAALYQAWFPERASSVWNFQAWMDTLIPPARTAEERLAIFSGFAGLEAGQAEPTLATIEELRRSLILQRDHVAHCFLELPSSQKNRRLRELFLQYLDSPLAEDFTAGVWNLIHALKTKSFKLQSEDWVFIPAPLPGFLFKEFTTAALSNHPGSEVRPFSELEDSYATADPVVWHGARGRCLEDFAEQLLALGDGPHWIPLAATAGAEAWLRYRLLYGGKRSVRWSVAAAANDFFTQMLGAVKRRSEMPSLQRLRLVSTLRKRPPRQNETRELYLQRICPSLISESERAWFEGLSAENPEVETNSLPVSFYFIPWQAVPATAATPGLAYFDESLWQIPREPTLLNESERELLNRVGFPVTSFAARQRALERQTRRLAASRPNDLPVLYSAAGQSLIEEWKIECRPLVKEPEAPEAIEEAPPKNFHAPLAGRSLSATSLETFADCPAKYWVSRLKLTKEEDLLDRYALFFGQAVHASLENIFQSADSLTTENLSAYFERALQAIDPLLTQKGSLALLFTEAFRKLAPRILECEKMLAALFPGSRRVGFEQGFEIEERGLRLIGKIDRIDQLADGGTVVLDYKTGTIDFTPDHIAQGKNFQALLYWLAAEKLYGAEPAGIIFYDLKKGELRRGLMQEERVSAEVKKAMTRGHVLAAEKRNALLERGREHLDRMADLIQKGTFAPTPSAEACRFCEAATFCRQAVGYA